MMNLNVNFLNEDKNVERIKYDAFKIVNLLNKSVPCDPLKCF